MAKDDSAATTALERPNAPLANAPAFGSDVVADTLRALDIPWLTLNPGASFRGLHDSLVNYLGNAAPQMLLCLHEESAVAIAHGWAKVTGKPMAVALHSNVGLMHATMAIFNAWCDRMPIVMLGATGPVDAVKRRPWIDWIHTARDQGALIRGYTKWDDQPSSPAAAREALLRAAWIASTAPMGPTYVNLDAGMQEARLEAPLPPIDAARHRPPAQVAAPADMVEAAARLLGAAKKPVILAGRVSRSMTAWDQRIALAERLGAAVVTDLKVGAAFPTDHPLHAGAPAIIAPDAVAAEALRAADVILSLDWTDLAGTLKTVLGAEPPRAKIIQVSVDHLVHNGWSMDYQGLPPVDIMLAATPDSVVPLLLASLGPGAKRQLAPRPATPPDPALEKPTLQVAHLARALRAAVAERPITFAHLPLSWNAAWWPLRHPLDFLGSDGGGGIGGGPGISVGAALALRGSGRMTIGICGDGDFLMGVTSIWTAVHYRIPLLLISANNRSFYNDEVHQERVARMRERPVENKWIGQRMSDPEIDLAALGRAQGAAGFGPVRTVEELCPALTEAIAKVDAGGVAVVDVRVEPGYTPAMSADLTRGAAAQGRTAKP